MTERLYLNDAYLYEFNATIIGVKTGESGIEIILDKTVFYPETGGQLYDKGLLDGHLVTAAFEIETDEIVHIVSDWTAPIGATVKGVIDERRRQDNRSKHTGQHILSRAFLDTAGGETVSSRLGEVESTIELSVNYLDDAAIARAETMANDIVLDNLPINIAYYDREELKKLPIRKIPERDGKFRIVRIGDFDYTACGGTHCRNTGEVGLIKIIGREKLRGHLRVIFLSGHLAFDDYNEKHQVITRLAEEFTCHFRDLPTAIEKMTEQNQFLRRELNNHNALTLYNELSAKIDAAPKFGEVIIFAAEYDNSDLKILKETALKIARERKAMLVLWVDDKVLIVSSEKTGLPASKAAQLFMAKFGGKGGGSITFAQVGGLSKEKRAETNHDFLEIIKNEIGRQ